MTDSVPAAQKDCPKALFRSERKLKSPVVIFATAATANYLVAGIPAAARALHTLNITDGIDQPRDLVIAVPGGWEPTEWCRAEFARLLPNITISIFDANGLDQAEHPLGFPGEDIAAGQHWQTPVGISVALDRAIARSEQEHLARLRQAGDAIVAATGKAHDGMVSQYLNRPISRFITRLVLRLPGATPMHGTIATAIIGIAMAACLLLGRETGLMAGALLLQGASIMDGVDGEIARATFRSSDRGAMLDTLTDAATNLAFVAGVAFNLWQQGMILAPAAGAAGLAMLATGLALLARRSLSVGGPFTFDAVKHHFRAQPSRFKACLAMITTRDFYVAAFTLLTVAGFAAQALITFSCAVAMWFIVTVTVLSKRR